MKPAIQPASKFKRTNPHGMHNPPIFKLIPQSTNQPIINSIQFNPRNWIDWLIN